MDALNTLKSLKLTLEPLRGSFLLRQIDLSLVEQHESPVIEPKLAISATVAIPLIDSFIERENSVEHIQLPRKWREEKVKFGTSHWIDMIYS